MKKNLTLLLAFTLLFSACKKDQNSTSINLQQPEKRWSIKEMDDFIVQTINDKQTVFDWKDAPADMLYSALISTDNIMAIGFKPADAKDEDSQSYKATTDKNWKSAKDALVKMIVESEQRANPSVDYSKFEIGTDFDNLNAFYIKISNFETIQKLRQSPLVRYAYPSGYSTEDHQLSQRGESGCDGYVGENLVAGTDYVTISPNAKQSWTYSYQQIAQAWARTTGAGVKVMVIDAGFSSAQTMLQSANWASGSSLPTRTIELLSRYPSQLNFWGTSVVSYDPSPYSSCGHGTTMAGIVGSPRNNVGTSVGVAYNANLVCVRAVEDVVISNSKEELGVAAALNLAASRSDIKIVSMSLGSIFSRSVIGDAIKAVRNAGKLPFCAAGTSTDFTTWFGVVYPASMAEAIAVTGVTEKGQICPVCHEGSAVDYVAVMDRASDGLSVLSLAVTGNLPATIGGSSAATAKTAGIAALVWARQPSQTAAQVLTRLTNAGSYYPTKTAYKGWGIVNANAATNF